MKKDFIEEIEIHGYTYDSLEQMIPHMKAMIREGWQVVVHNGLHAEFKKSKGRKKVVRKDDIYE